MIHLQDIKHIGIGTLKENKKQGLIDACHRLGIDQIAITGYDVDTGVADQPITREETLLGSVNRAKNCFKQNPQLDMACGAEGGVYFNTAKTRVYMIGAVTLIDSSGYLGSAFGGEIELPPAFITPLLEGAELKDLMDTLRGTEGANHREGAVGFFTNNTISRSDAFETMIINAFVPWLHQELY